MQSQSSPKRSPSNRAPRQSFCLDGYNKVGCADRARARLAKPASSEAGCLAMLLLAAPNSRARSAARERKRLPSAINIGSIKLMSSPRSSSAALVFGDNNGGFFVAFYIHYKTINIIDFGALRCSSWRVIWRVNFGPSLQDLACVSSLPRAEAPAESSNWHRNAYRCDDAR